MWEVFTHGGRNKTGINALEFAKKMEDSGAGELLVTSMDRDGTQVGYDIDLMSKISSTVNIPVIASGGLGSIKDFYDLVGLQVNGSGLAGVITGRALYEKCLDLRELIAITEDPEHVELEHD